MSPVSKKNKYVIWTVRYPFACFFFFLKGIKDNVLEGDTNKLDSDTRL